MIPSSMRHLPKVLNIASRHACVDSTLEFCEKLINESPNKKFTKETVITLLGFARNDRELMEVFDRLDRAEEASKFWHLGAGLAVGILLGAIVAVLTLLQKG